MPWCQACSAPPHTLRETARQARESSALVHGRRERLLDFAEEEHPIALQLGGSDPGELSRCAHFAAERGFDEINLNVGCPSDRVRRGRFGACLMAEPDVVARCVRAMIGAGGLPVTVKTRIGIDDRDRYEDLAGFAGAVVSAGCGTLVIHARKAWLTGLSPKENREIPPAALRCRLPAEGGLPRDGSHRQRRHHLARRGRRAQRAGRRFHDGPRGVPQPLRAGGGGPPHLRREGDGTAGSHRDRTGHDRLRPPGAGTRDAAARRHPTHARSVPCHERCAPLAPTPERRGGGAATTRRSSARRWGGSAAEARPVVLSGHAGSASVPTHSTAPAPSSTTGTGTGGRTGAEVEEVVHNGPPRTAHAAVRATRGDSRRRTRC